MLSIVQCTVADYFCFGRSCLVISYYGCPFLYVMWFVHIVSESLMCAACH